MNHGRFKQKEQLPLHNRQITASQVRLVGTLIFDGVCSFKEAIKYAEASNLDLIVINNQEIPVCKIMAMDKYLYEQKQKEKQQKKQSAASETKEIRLSVGISEHDLSYRIKNALEWLKDGDKVKCSLMFKGREIIHKDRGELVLLQFAESVKEQGVPEHLPKLEGKKMFIIIKPKGKK